MYDHVLTTFDFCLTLDGRFSLVEDICMYVCMYVYKLGTFRIQNSEFAKPACGNFVYSGTVFCLTFSDGSSLQQNIQNKIVHFWYILTSSNLGTASMELILLFRIFKSFSKYVKAKTYFQNYHSIFVNSNSLCVLIEDEKLQNISYKWMQIC
jgi:hypothetical protein